MYDYNEESAGLIKEDCSH